MSQAQESLVSCCGGPYHPHGQQRHAEVRPHEACAPAPRPATCRAASPTFGTTRAQNDIFVRTDAGKYALQGHLPESDCARAVPLRALSDAAAMDADGDLNPAGFSGRPAGTGRGGGRRGGGRGMGKRRKSDQFGAPAKRFKRACRTPACCYWMSVGACSFAFTIALHLHGSLCAFLLLRFAFGITMSVCFGTALDGVPAELFMKRQHHLSLIKGLLHGNV